VATMVSLCSSPPTLCPLEQKGPSKTLSALPERSGISLQVAFHISPTPSHLLSWAVLRLEGLAEFSGSIWTQSRGGMQKPSTSSAGAALTGHALPCSPAIPHRLPCSLWQESSESTNTTIEDEDTKGREGPCLWYPGPQTSWRLLGKPLQWELPTRSAPCQPVFSPSAESSFVS
jgi:hypothetical protein